MSLFAKLLELERLPYAYALCTVVSVSGSTPRKASAKMIVVDNGDEHGAIFGTIGGGAIEHHLRARALQVIAKKKPELVTTSLRNELGMCCGGEMTVFIEPIVRTPELYCFGAGHIGQALCPLAFSCGFRVNVIDERQEMLAHSSFKDAQRFAETNKFSLSDLPFTKENTYFVIATHDHELDQAIAEIIVDKPHKYAALVGSMRKALMTKKRMEKKGYPSDVIARIRCPAGLSINAETPNEIALAILAEMIQIKNA